jgi:phosphoglucosamine mutase
MPLLPQVVRNLPRAARGPLPETLLARVASVNEELAGSGRVLVRPSGTEPIVRILAEAESQEAAENLCASIATLVTDELG